MFLDFGMLNIAMEEVWVLVGWFSVFTFVNCSKFTATDRLGLQIKFHYFYIFQCYHNSDSLQVLRKATPNVYSLDAVLC